MTSAHHITRIEIRHLWPHCAPLVWELHPEVNVLSGHNGAGKSTILSSIARHLQALAKGTASACANDQGICLHFSPEGATSMPFDWIRSYDRPLVAAEGLRQIEGGALRSELDWQLYLLQRRYLDYQVSLANQIIALMASAQPEAAQQVTALARQKNRFYDIVDELFAETGKRIDRTHNELRFTMNALRLSPYALSSGEKQLLLILLTVLTQHGKPHLLLMDEPEASLHFDWQQRLIALVRELNPAAQIILSTHSPALILEGWEDQVVEASSLFVP